MQWLGWWLIGCVAYVIAASMLGKFLSLSNPLDEDLE